MRFGISYLGVDEHGALLEEESRRAAQLEELLRQSLLQSRDDPMADGEKLRKCMEAVRTVADSIRWRIQFLGELNEKMRKTADRLHAMTSELEEDLG